MSKVYDLIVIGGGPAGATAALYAGRSNLNVLVIEKPEVGALISAHKIDNYPGFPNGITGKELYETIQKQAQKFGAEFVEDTFLELDIYSHPRVVKASKGNYEGTGIIIATGWPKNNSKKIIGEKEFIGNGVSYCATCDGFFTKGRITSVFGNGHEAVEEALFLTKHAKQINVFCDKDDLEVEAELKEQLLSNENVKLFTNAKLLEVLGNQYVEKVKVDIAGEIKEMESDFAFLYLGTKSNSELYQGFAKLNDEGYIITDENMACEVEGVWAAGDIRERTVRQVTTAVADGTLAGIEAIKYVMKKKREVK
ncbi:MAG: FAD-dependent oxidoreductase [Fusobacteriaceae bacterium]|jgi:thioredoxin reductase (NADPH)|nr:FAD-dependent oxidoreductase [Fusobacteriaceae bacterium]MBP6468357.1 FAD-dependent oxidoreductase [Fusobacteriaceae bacterium]MBU9918801.1 FAD-dependent oxidoreductase [Fusobacteriaceae bacterium]